MVPSCTNPISFPSQVVANKVKQRSKEKLLLVGQHMFVRNLDIASCDIGILNLLLVYGRSWFETANHLEAVFGLFEYGEHVVDF